MTALPVSFTYTLLWARLFTYYLPFYKYGSAHAIGYSRSRIIIPKVLINVRTFTLLIGNSHGPLPRANSNTYVLLLVQTHRMLACELDGLVSSNVYFM